MSCNNSTCQRDIGWCPYPQERVNLVLIPVNPSNEEVRDYRVVNTADGDRELGILRLNEDEVKFFTSRLSSGKEETQYYQTWLRERMNNPTKYQLNGKMLSLMRNGERLNALTSAWNSSVPVNAIKD